MTSAPKGWKRGLPPGPYYAGMVDDFEVSFTAGGTRWHRKRTPEERAEYIERTRAPEKVDA
jgi:hypothetical protein